MTTQIFWDDSQNGILRLHVENSMTSEELRETFDKILAEIEAYSSEQAPNIIATTHNVKRIPMNCFTIAAEFTNALPDETDVYIVAGNSSSYVVTIAQTFIRLYPFQGLRVKVVSSFEQVKRILAQAKCC